jgi:hypothetical protein
VEILEKNKMNLNRLVKYLALILFSILFFVFLGNLFNYHYELIKYPYQHEYREGAPFLLASEFLKGNFPYTFKNQPYLSDVFGCMYSICSLPFLKLFGVKLSSMRILSAVSIFLIVIYFFKIQRKQKVSLSQSIVFCVVLYAVNLFSCIPIVRPDALGFLFFILTIYVPISYHYSRRSILVSLLFCFLSYFTKSYFIVGFLFVLMSMFLNLSKIRSIKYFLLFILLFVCLLFSIHLVFDFYFIGTFSTQLSSTVNDFYHLLNQLRFYFIDLFILPLTLIILMFLRTLVLNRSTFIQIIENPIQLKNCFDFKQLKEPFLKTSKIDENILYFVLGLTLIILKLGGHTGQFGVYLIHFMTFPLLLIVSNKFEYIKKYINPTIVLISSIVLIYPIYKVLPITNKLDKTNMNQLSLEIKSKKNVLATPMLASVLVEQKKFVYASGLTEYFFYVPSFRNNYGLPSVLAKIKDKLFLKTINDSEIKIAKYLNEIRSKVKNGEFDVVYLDNSEYDDWLITKTDLNKRYKFVHRIEVKMIPCYQEYTILKYVLKN